MADRVRSKDGSRDTDKILGRDDGVEQQDSAGGDLARSEGREDELKRAFERPAGATRVTKSDKPSGRVGSSGIKEG